MLRRDCSVPHWMQLAAVVPASCLTGLGGSALVLAMLGIYRLWLALLVGLPLCLGLFALASRAVPRGRPPTRSEQWAALAALALAAISLAVYGYHPSQYTFIDADPGSYSSTARWIAREGSLRGDAATGPFKGAPNLQYQTPAVYDMGGGHIEFQFNHLASAAMAVAFSIGGQRALFRLSALSVALALLPLYVLGCALLRRPWLALVAAATLAQALPMIWIGRGTYSEAYTVLPLMAGLVVLCWLWVSPRVGTAILAGALIGTTVMARIDGIAYLLPLLPIAALLWLRRRRATVAALLLAAVVPTVIGSLDLRYLTGRYGSDLAVQRGQLEKALLLMTVLCIVAVALARPLTAAWSRIVRSRAGLIAGGLATLGFLAGWIVRPMIRFGHHGSSTFIAGLEAREGVTVDESRSLSAYTLRWIGWYFGPLVMVLAALGLGVLVWRFLSGRGSVAEALLGSYLLFAGALYIVNPEVNPFQIWAMRRFVPLVLPGVVLLAGIAIDQILAVVGRWRPSTSLAPVLAGVGAAALLLPTAAATAYDGAIKEQAGFLRVFEAACATERAPTACSW